MNAEKMYISPSPFCMLATVVGEPPVIKNCSKDDMCATVGKSILISCTAQGNPPPSFTWRHHGSLISSDGEGDVCGLCVCGCGCGLGGHSPLCSGHVTCSVPPADPHYHFPSAGFLQIPVARESDSGYYTCTAMNACGSVSRCFHVEVNYPERESFLQHAKMAFYMP